MRTHPAIRAIGVSHTACKDEFRRNLPSHRWSVFLCLQYTSQDTRQTKLQQNSKKMNKRRIMHKIVRRRRRKNEKDKKWKERGKQGASRHTWKTKHIRQPCGSDEAENKSSIRPSSSIHTSCIITIESVCGTLHKKMILKSRSSSTNNTMMTMITIISVLAISIRHMTSDSVPIQHYPVYPDTYVRIQVRTRVVRRS